MIWGSKRIGSKCSFCGLNCHKEDCEAGASKLSCGSVGVVRVRYKYTDEYILPLPTYAKLMEVRLYGEANCILNVFFLFFFGCHSVFHEQDTGRDRRLWHVNR